LFGLYKSEKSERRFEMKAPEPGIYTGIPFDEYLTWEAVNNTLLRTIATQSPAHAKAYKDNPPDPTPAFIFGNGLHCLALEPDKFKDRYAIQPVFDGRTKEGKAIKAKFKEGLNGKKVITAEDYNLMQFMAEAIKKQAIHRFIEKGEAEICIVWIDKKTGLLCKARIDYLHRDHAILIDLKSARDASPDTFSRSAFNYGYWQQSAWYCDGWKTLTGDMPAFVFLVAEKTIPFAVAAYEMPDEGIIAGRKTYRAALKIYAECLKKDSWPGYSNTVEMLNLPTWALNKSGVNKYQIEEDENE
jgi:exodeoxyribonuclease VIII